MIADTTVKDRYRKTIKFSAVALTNKKHRNNTNPKCGVANLLRLTPPQAMVLRLITKCEA